MALSGEAVSTFIIAELGVNHQGDMKVATKLIVAAKEAGADACKFQTYDPDILEPPGPRREMLRRLMLSHGQHRVLKAQVERRGMEFISTPFDVPSLRFLVDELKVKTLKIASGNLDNWPLLEAAADSRCHVIVSTGGASLAQVAKIEWVSRAATLRVLHCVSAYPASVGMMNLAVLPKMDDLMVDGVGLSDHTTSLLIPALAVAMGATVIEKHLTLDRNADGPDHRASLEPEQFKIMVDNIREAELAMGDGVKRPQACEAAAMAVMAERKAWREQLPTN